MNEKAIELAKLFHKTYERLAPSYFYTTRKDSAVVWDKVPKQNRDLMVAVAEHILAELAKKPEPKCETCGGSGEVGTEPCKVGLDGLSERTIPCPDCQQPEPTGFTKEVRDFIGDFALNKMSSQGVFEFSHKYGEYMKDALIIIDRQAEEKRQKDAEILRLKARRISNSCVECAYLGGDCCGVLYSTVDGRVLCNECGREFDINLKDK